MSTPSSLTQEQLTKWSIAQQGELAFWKDWMETADHKDDMLWLSYVLQYFGFSDGQDFGTQTLIDLGSGPIGLLTRLRATCRIAVDPLPLVNTADMDILRIRRPAERTGLPSSIADQVYIYNLLQHVISPIHVLDECTRLLKSGGRVFLLEQLNLPTDSEHPHTLRIEMFDQWVQRENYHVEKRSLVQDSILSSVSSSRPGSGYCVLYLMATKP
jgi:hypothetical protein